MINVRLACPLLLVLSACSPGTWTLTIWGEDLIEEGIDASEFEDGCTATFDAFLVQVRDRALLDASGAVAGAIEGSQVYDLVAPGPHTMGTAEVAPTFYDTLRVRIGPGPGATPGNATAAQVALLGEHAYRVEGSITCGADTVTYAWSFDTDTTYLCEPDGLTIPSGGAGATELTMHGDHLFYDALEDPDAGLRAAAMVDADDGDGVLTLAELAAVPIAGLGYDVGRFAEVTDLAAFVTLLTRTFGHVDGEGHCDTDL